MCLKELRDEFLYACECRHLAKGSLRNYRASTRFLLEFLERKQITELEDVRPRHLRDLMKEKQDAKNINGHCNLARLWCFARKRPLYGGRKEEKICGVGNSLKSHRSDR